MGRRHVAGRSRLGCGGIAARPADNRTAQEFRLFVFAHGRWGALARGARYTGHRLGPGRFGLLAWLGKFKPGCLWRARDFLTAAAVFSVVLTAKLDSRRSRS